jgi:rhodanese-related sulfurtransferase/GNAT superfamily N-acetyltransferase
MEIRPLRPGDASACDAIVAGLPAWFGDPGGIEECAAAVRSQRGLVAVTDGLIIGFLTVTSPREHVAEISWMAVGAAHRGRGVGRALIEALVADLHRDRARYLVVKTLSDRDDDPGYAATRAFYEAMAFTPLMDLDIWGPANPALVLVRSVSMPPHQPLGAPAPTAEDLAVAARSGAQRISPAHAAAELDSGAVLIDHRTLEQRREHGDIPGAIRMSMTVVPWRLDPQSPWKIPVVTDHDTRVIIVCQEGYSSSLSLAWLRDLGMRHVADIEGGFEAWRDAGLPVAPLEED